MKNIRKFETTAEMESAVLENVSINYNVETGDVLSMPLKPIVIDHSTMYTTFEALEDGTFSFTKSGTGDNIQYSKDDGTTWTSLAYGKNVSVVTGDKVMWKSTIAPSTSGNYGIGTFSSSNKFNVSGNIMSLLYGDDFNGLTSLEGNDYALYNLFKGCNGLIDTFNLILPATTLTDNCYSNMFNGCASLATTPELPATTLYRACYFAMFYHCTSLTIAPELPVTTLTYGCYGNMFSGCTSLTTAPELPATTLADSCYYGMFAKCTSLKTAPELPATTLVNYCYCRMFSGCTSLTTAPELPVTTLAEDCYDSMFAECTSLKTAPELPATTLANGCYSYMFYGCRSLTTAPELPATTLVDYCYDSMFENCYNLSHIIMLATDISAKNCLDYWVRYVSSTGTFYKHPDMNDLPLANADNDYVGIPYGWTVEDAVL